MVAMIEQSSYGDGMMAWDSEMTEAGGNVHDGLNIV